ncbi:hypothetical protein ASPWEDRAFT_41077 [Aspergillus wentii DTO 134E9]|uniref:NmrA-like domain-containing protein n=1 Tax=Aspergillus wentii DTO 134E9 TaxID=1073089 RepID=A0A1L9RLM3_ASPWE|nr:uncharacterized protein ASPWEDRAFT_41077 [Aspergillus wentii DTO 134E9]OJJ35836.1 hypothetical protein ASPWEDRAFT_41077 [Aspergillus wentii DTO 134E9]
MLTACQMSEHCKRFIPSDYGGDIDRFPYLPRFYDSTHRVFRDTLANVEDVEWTVVKGGWFMDYFVQGSKVDPTIIPYGGSSHGNQPDNIFDTTKARSYMKPLPGILPLDLDTLTATVPGTGDEPVGWTSARDVARALVKLLDAPFGTWERHTYVVGDIQTWNEAIKTVEHFYRKRFTVTHKTTENILQAVEDEKLDDVQRAIAYMDEWNITGASAVPIDKVVEQREWFFSDMRFRGIGEYMEDAFLNDLDTMV